MPNLSDLKTAWFTTTAGEVATAAIGAAATAADDESATAAAEERAGRRATSRLRLSRALGQGGVPGGGAVAGGAYASRHLSGRCSPLTPGTEAESGRGGFLACEANALRVGRRTLAASGAAPTSQHDGAADEAGTAMDESWRGAPLAQGAASAKARCLDLSFGIRHDCIVKQGVGQR